MQKMFILTKKKEKNKNKQRKEHNFQLANKDNVNSRRISLLASKSILTNAILYLLIECKIKDFSKKGTWTIS